MIVWSIEGHAVVQLMLALQLFVERASCLVCGDGRGGVCLDCADAEDESAWAEQVAHERQHAAGGWN